MEKFSLKWKLSGITRLFARNGSHCLAPQLAGEACFLQRMGNLSGIRVGCVSARPTVVPLARLDPQLYAGFATRFPGSAAAMAAAGGAKEYVSAYEVYQLMPSRLNVTVRFNDTTQVRQCSERIRSTSYVAI